MINIRNACTSVRKSSHKKGLSSFVPLSSSSLSSSLTIISSSRRPSSFSPADNHRHIISRRFTFSSSSLSSSSSSSSSWNWESGQGLINLLTNQQRSLLDEQRELSSTAIRLARRVGGVDLQHCGSSSSSSSFQLLQHILAPNNNNNSNDNDNDNDNDNHGGNSDQVLDSTFSVVIAGEFNAGKSTLINALLGQKLLETGAIPTTDTITVLTSKQATNKDNNNNSNNHNNQSTTQKLLINDNTRNQNTNTITTTTTTSHSNAITLHRVPNIPLLKDLTFIDTPGTNAIVTNHTTRTLKLLPSADLILFVTSADRPFPESERQLLQSIQAYRKNIVIVINKMDVLEASGGNHGEEEKKRVLNFVSDNAADLLGARAVILPVSARDALSAKLIHGTTKGINGNINSSSSSSNNNDGEKRIESSKMWKRSGFTSLESFLKDSLTEDVKVQAKLLNPLGVTDGMLSECMDVLKYREKELETDIATLNLLNNQMSAWRRDMDIDIKQFQRDVKDHMGNEMDRCSALVESIGFFEKYPLCLIDDGTKLEYKWDNTKSIIVSNDIENEILENVRESTDAIATSARAQGQAVIEYLGKRPAIVGQNLIGSVTAASRFEDTRKELFEKITRSVQTVFATYDPEKEKDAMFQSLRHAVYLSSSLNILSMASGIATALEAIDIYTGGLTSLSFAIVGLGIVPQRNRQIVQDFESRWEQRNEKLSAALDALCSKEITRIHKRILDGVSPYSRYVTTEQENVETFTEECQTLLASSQSLRNRIGKLR